MKQPKEVILKALRIELAGLKDEEARLQLACRNNDLDKKYGASGLTLRQLQLDITSRKAEVENAILWANTL